MASYSNPWIVNLADPPGAYQMSDGIRKHSDIWSEFCVTEGAAVDIFLSDDFGLGVIFGYKRRNVFEPYEYTVSKTFRRFYLKNPYRVQNHPRRPFRQN